MSEPWTVIRFQRLNIGCVAFRLLVNSALITWDTIWGWTLTTRIWWAEAWDYIRVWLSRWNQGYTYQRTTAKFPRGQQLLLIRHLYISHAAPCVTSPPPPILHNLCFSFLPLLQPFQEKLKTMLMQFFFFFWGGGGQIRCILGDVRVAILSSPFSLFSDWLIVLICPSIFCSVYKVDKNMSPFCDNISLT